MTKASDFVRKLYSAYELEKADGSRGRNTEFFVVDGDKVKKCDVYFGPSLPIAVSARADRG
jgi:hypothetical protein